MPESRPAVRPEEALANMIASLKEKTGRSLDEWKAVVAEHGWGSHGVIVKGLKETYAVSHGYANQIALRSLQIVEPSGDPIAGMFAKRPEAREIYDALLPQIQAFGPDVDLAPKKGYVSVRRSKQFAILQPAAGRLDVGIQLKGFEPEGRLEASGSFNAMLTHRVRVATVGEADQQLLAWLRAAYEAA